MSACAAVLAAGMFKCNDGALLVKVLDDDPVLLSVSLALTVKGTSLFVVKGRALEKDKRGLDADEDEEDSD